MPSASCRTINSRGRAAGDLPSHTQTGHPHSFACSGPLVASRIVTSRAAAAKDPTLPKLRGPIALARRRPTQKKIIQVLIASLLQKPNVSEARVWLTKAAGVKTARSLGRFRNERQAAQFVKELYKAGAIKVIAPDIYGNGKGDQFADCLIVRLPKDARRRRAIRRVGAMAKKRKLGVVEPDKDIGETHLFLSLF